MRSRSLPLFISYAGNIIQLFLHNTAFLPLCSQRKGKNKQRRKKWRNLPRRVKSRLPIRTPVVVLHKTAYVGYEIPRTDEFIINRDTMPCVCVCMHVCMYGNKREGEL